MNGVVAFAGAASLPAGALILALTAVPALRRPQRVGLLVRAQIALAAAILALGASAVAFPSLVPSAPTTGTTSAYVVLAVGCILFAGIALRAIRTWQLTRRPADLLTVVGLAWLSLALVAQMTIPFTQLAFYVGHGLELAGVIALGLPAALDLRRAAASMPLVGDLTAADLVAREEAFLGARVARSSCGWARRTPPPRATRAGSRCWPSRSARRWASPAAGCAGSRSAGCCTTWASSRSRARCSRSPARSTTPSSREIRKHPQAGVRLLREVGGFAPGVLRLVLDHHERLDGSGYPRGLMGDELDSETRILAVCDVYDALVSDRVYRSAWTPERAFALLRDEAQFDPACVAALEQVLAPPFVADIAAPAPALPAPLRPAPRRA